ncbi:MAG: tetratricopeptide repeat protein [Bacteroidota bacterium]
MFKSISKQLQQLWSFLTRIPLQKSVEKIGHFASGLFKVALGVLVVLLLMVVIRGIQDDGYHLEPFRVPQNLEDRGFNGITLANQLLDEVERVKKISNSTIGGQGLLGGDGNSLSTESRPEMKVTILGLGVSIDALIYYLRDFVGKKTQTISGELTQGDSLLNLSLRVTGYPAEKVTVNYAGKDLQMAMNELYRKGAERLWKLTDPFVVALYFLRLEEIDKSMELVKYMLTKPKLTKEDKKMAYLMWASIDGANKDYVAYLEHAKKAVEYGPEDWISWYTYGTALYYNGKMEEAVEAYEKELTFHPEKGERRQSHLSMLSQAGQPEKLDQEIAFWEENADPNSSLDLLTLAACRYFKGNLDAYHVLVDSAYALDPENKRTLYAHYVSSLLRQDTTTAIKNLEQYMWHENETLDFYRSLIGMKVMTRKNEEALSLVEEAKEKHGEHPHLLNLKAMANYQKKDFPAAFAAINQAIELSPKESFLYSTLAETYHYAGDTDNFYRSLEKAQSLGFDFNMVANQPPYTLYKDQPRYQALLAQKKPATPE